MIEDSDDAPEATLRRYHDGFDEEASRGMIGVKIGRGNVFTARMRSGLMLVREYHGRLHRFGAEILTVLQAWFTSVSE